MRLKSASANLILVILLSKLAPKGRNMDMDGRSRGTSGLSNYMF